MSSSTRHFCIKLETLFIKLEGLYIIMVYTVYVDLEGKLLKSLVSFFCHYIVVEVTISMSQLIHNLFNLVIVSTPI